MSNSCDPDLLAHGETEIVPDQDVSVTANAEMLKQFLDALSIDKVDLVGNNSGGGIAQTFAALYPERVRTLGTIKVSSCLPVSKCLCGAQKGETILR